VRGASKAPSRRGASAGTLALFALGFSACGSSTTSGGGSAQTQNPQAFAIHAQAAAIRDFGATASSSQTRQAEVALRGYLSARANEEWSKACSYLDRSKQRLLGRVAASSKQIEGKSCATFLASGFEALSSPERADLAKADVASVRVDGDWAYAIYSTPSNTEYATAMEIDAGEWKVAGIEPRPLQP